MWNKRKFWIFICTEAVVWNWKVSYTVVYLFCCVMHTICKHMRLWVGAGMYWSVHRRLAYFVILATIKRLYYVWIHYLNMVVSSHNERARATRTHFRSPNSFKRYEHLCWFIMTILWCRETFTVNLRLMRIISLSCELRTQCQHVYVSCLWTHHTCLHWTQMNTNKCRTRVVVVSVRCIEYCEARLGTIIWYLIVIIIYYINNILHE